MDQNQRQPDDWPPPPQVFISRQNFPAKIRHVYNGTERDDRFTSWLAVLVDAGCLYVEGQVPQANMNSVDMTENDVIMSPPPQPVKAIIVNVSNDVIVSGCDMFYLGRSLCLNITKL